jgi:hypothetical protein
MKTCRQKTAEQLSAGSPALGADASGARPDSSVLAGSQLRTKRSAFIPAGLSDDARRKIAEFGQRLLLKSPSMRAAAVPESGPDQNEVSYERRVALWNDYLRASMPQRFRALQRLIAVSVAAELIAAGLERRAACAMTPAAIASVLPICVHAGSYSGPQIERFLQKTERLDREHWLPALLDLDWGRPKKGERR